MQAFAITYRITGTVPQVEVLYDTPAGTSDTTTTVLPWTTAFQADATTELLLVATVVQGSGTLTCEIYVNNTLEETVTTRAGETEVICDLSLEGR